jgi:pimeloyl-ACP methyl ester carboxylesterase
VATQLVPNSQKVVRAGDLDLWTESFGQSSDPAVLLVMGAWNQGIAWPEEFCIEIARQGYFVIRYDNRDTGQSSSVDFESEPYDLDAMTRDAIAILDGYRIAKAHVVGLSMGGFIAQLLGLDYPDRVLTLTLMMTSPDQAVSVAAVSGQDTSHYTLPPPSPRLLAQFARMRQQPPKSADEALESGIESWRVANGEGVPFDDAWTRQLLERTAARTKNRASANNHTFAMAASPARTERLKEIAVPTLVIHGQHDPLLPLDHGNALAKAIPTAKLVVIPDMGHMFSPRLCGRVAKMTLGHISGHAG